MSDPQSSKPLQRAEVGEWLAAYAAAWERKDAEAAGRLFSEDARYYETPFAEPFRGQSGIRDYWSRVTADQRDIAVGYDVVGVVGNIGIARWNARFMLSSTQARIELNGVFLLEFGADNRCAVLREWWHAR